MTRDAEDAKRAADEMAEENRAAAAKAEEARQASVQPEAQVASAKGGTTQYSQRSLASND